MPQREKLAITVEQQFRQPFTRETGVAPSQTRRVEPVEILLDDQPLSQKVVVLLGAGNRAEDIEGSPGRVHLAQHLQMFMDLLLAVLRKPNDVGEVRTDSVLAAQPHDVFVRLRTVLAFVGCQQDLSIERLDTNEQWN